MLPKVQNPTVQAMHTSVPCGRGELKLTILFLLTSMESKIIYYEFIADVIVSCGYKLLFYWCGEVPEKTPKRANCIAFSTDL